MQTSGADRHNEHSTPEVSKVQQQFRLDSIQQCAMRLEICQQMLIASQQRQCCLPSCSSSGLQHKSPVVIRGSHTISTKGMHAGTIMQSFKVMLMQIQGRHCHLKEGCSWNQSVLMNKEWQHRRSCMLWRADVLSFAD